jgi:hypothetical protein
MQDTSEKGMQIFEKNNDIIKKFTGVKAAGAAACTVRILWYGIPRQEFRLTVGKS